MSRKGIVASLVFLPLFATLIALGTWQVQRLHWKTALIANLTAGINAPAQEITGDVPPAEFHHVRVSGALLADKPLTLYARTKDGVAGVHIFAALQRAGGSPIMIDRGFLPTPVDPALATAPSFGEIDGIIRLVNGKAWFEPVNDPARNQWYWPDLAAMANAAGVGNPAPFFIEAVSPMAATGSTPTGPVPTGKDILPNIRNEHLQYAITWYSLAAVFAVIYILSLRQKR